MILYQDLHQWFLFCNTPELLQDVSAILSQKPLKIKQDFYLFLH